MNNNDRRKSNRPTIHADRRDDPTDRGVRTVRIGFVILLWLGAIVLAGHAMGWW